MLDRFRIGWVALLATCTGLQIWAANVMHNEVDGPLRAAMNKDDQREVVWARLALIGFSANAALDILLIIMLGEPATNEGLKSE